MVEGGMKCVKYLLFGFNLIFFLAGLGLIIAGALVATEFNEYFDFFGGGFSAAAILLIVVGAIVFFIGFFGCCGAYKENYCMVMVFAVLLGLIFILEIAAGITAYVLRDQVEKFVTKNLEKPLEKYGIDKHEGVTSTWDKAQKDADEFVENKLNDAMDNYNMTGHDGVTRTWDKAQTEGCKDAFVSWVKDNVYIIAGVGIGLAFVQILGIILAVCLARSIKKEYEVV